MFERIIAVTVGSILIGIGVNGFLIPFHLMEGGMIGVGLIAKYKWGFETGLTIIILSCPIYIFTYFYNRGYFFSSIHGLLLSSFFIDILKPLRTAFHVPILTSAIIGGSLIGIGIGLMLRYKTSTGGLDLLAQFFSTILPLNVGVIIFIFDFFIIMTGSQLVETASLLHSILAVSFVALFTTYCTYSYTEK
ncbi:YitT family protein [Bacillus pinisoli]|uniref:YitT family protein n=1 Tax=Bacillus pinisoli TaxID=2901866 RepID=UPI001FF44B6A|nr:YitT family protein [Bacillus pinisoli]